jgi:hypothetical protein
VQRNTRLGEEFGDIQKIQLKGDGQQNGVTIFDWKIGFECAPFCIFVFCIKKSSLTNNFTIGIEQFIKCVDGQAAHANEVRVGVGEGYVWAALVFADDGAGF